MRYLVGLVLFALALGTLRMVGCGEESDRARQCETDEECDDQNECTNETCIAEACERSQVGDGEDCDFDGLPERYPNSIKDGVCVSGVCQENPCDDRNPCTFDIWHPDLGCSYGPIGDCSYGACETDDGGPGVCVGAGVCEPYPCNEICDDGNLCTSDSCECDPQHAHYGTCTFFDSCRSTQCAAAACDPAVGECVMTPTNEGKTCGCTGAVCICIVGTFRCVAGSCVCTL